jgi:hypothetical protein
MPVPPRPAVEPGDLGAERQLWMDSVRATARRLVALGGTIGEVAHLQPILREELRNVSDWQVDRSEETLPLPNWFPRPRGLDACARVGRTLSVAELKLRKTDEVLWDLLKMADALTLPQVRSAYLIVGVSPNAHGPDRCLELFDASVEPKKDVLALFFTNRMAWTKVLWGGSARPTLAPAVIRTEVLCAERIDLDGPGGRLCLVSVEPTAPPAVAFDPLHWCGDWPVGVEPTAAYLAWKRENWSFLRQLERRGPIAEPEAKVLARQHQLSLDKPYGLRYRGEMMINSGPQRSITPTGRRFLAEWASLGTGAVQA